MWETTKLSSCFPFLQGSPLPHTKHVFFPLEAGKKRITKQPLLVSAETLQMMQQPESYGFCAGSPDSHHVFSASQERKNQKVLTAVLWPCVLHKTYVEVNNCSLHCCVIRLQGQPEILLIFHEVAMACYTLKSLSLDYVSHESFLLQ